MLYSIELFIAKVAALDFLLVQFDNVRIWGIS